MCKAPKPPKPKEPKKPQFLRNRYLDEFVGGRGQIESLRTGRSQLRIPLGGPAPITGRKPGDSLVPVTTNVAPVAGGGSAPRTSVRPVGRGSGRERIQER